MLFYLLVQICFIYNLFYPLIANNGVATLCVQIMKLNNGGTTLYNLVSTQQKKKSKISPTRNSTLSPKYHEIFQKRKLPSLVLSKIY